MFLLWIVLLVLIRLFLKWMNVLGWFSICMFRKVRLLCRCCWVMVVLIWLMEVLIIVVGLLVNVLLLYGCDLILMVFFSMLGIDWLYLGVMNSIVLVVCIWFFSWVFCGG